MTLKELLRIILEDDTVESITEAGKHGDFPNGIPSGFAQLDRITGGWQRGDLIVVAARPSMGKTAFILSMARNMAMDYGCGVALFSLEMSAQMPVRRMVVSETEFDWERIRSGYLEPDEKKLLIHKIEKLAEAPVFIDDTPALSVSEFHAACSRLVQQHNVRIAMIDYLQLMTWAVGTKGCREQEVFNILRSLKAIAGKLNIPVIVLSQIGNTDRAGFNNKRPQMIDFRKSDKSVEQNADIVIFIHRPEYYGYTEDEEGNSLDGVAEIIIAKHRNGALGDMRLTFKKFSAKFVEPETL